MRKYRWIFSRQICTLGTGNRSDEQAELGSAAARRGTRLGQPAGKIVMALGRERNLMQLGLLM